MFNTGNCASVPLVANIDGNGNNNGWGAEGSWLWFIIVIFAIFGWGGFGNGFGGNGMNGGVGSEIQRGFDNQAVVSKLDGISNGFYAMDNSMLTGFNGINTNIMQTGYGIQQAVNADTVRIPTLYSHSLLTAAARQEILLTANRQRTTI